MKNSSISKVCALFTLVLAAMSAGATVYRERDEINKSFTLPAKARVDVSAISGSVDIKAIDGDTAFIQIERTARSRAELDCNRIVLKQAADNLIILSENTGACGTIQVRHRLLLSLPRYVDLSVHGVSGPINIGEMAGALRISGNSGEINLRQFGRGSRISGNSGTTTIKLRETYAGGLELSGNSGLLRLDVGDALNLNVRVTGLSGTVSSELPNVQFTKIGAADYSARIGSGGPTISVSGNSGSVLLGRYRE